MTQQKDSDFRWLYPVALMARVLEVSVSGFYDYVRRTPAPAAVRREEVTVQVKEVFTFSDATYGYRRVYAKLARNNILVSVDMVKSIMHENALVSVLKPKKRYLTCQEGDSSRVKDLLNRDFTAQVPGEKLIGDITYIPTKEGWLYLATVIDCYSRKVLGFAIDTHYRTSLIIAAMDHARKYHPIPSGAIFHSDRGSNYMSYEYSNHLAQHDIRQSAGRTGVCWDNSMAESFFSMIKREKLSRKTYPTREEAHHDIIRYIEHCGGTSLWGNNNTRLHSAIGYLTPNEKYYQKRKTAALAA